MDNLKLHYLPKRLMVGGLALVLLLLFGVSAMAACYEVVWGLNIGFRVTVEWLKVGELPSGFDWTHLGLSVPSYLERYLDIHISWVGLRSLLDYVPAVVALFFISAISYLTAVYLSETLDEL